MIKNNRYSRYTYYKSIHLECKRGSTPVGPRFIFCACIISDTYWTPLGLKPYGVFQSSFKLPVESKIGCGYTNIYFIL